MMDQSARSFSSGEPRRALVLVRNTRSGSYRRSRRRLEAALRQEQLRVVAAFDVGEAHRIGPWLSLPPVERPLIVAAGGDGTIGAVLHHLAGTDTVLGILPLGTNNQVARALGIPRRIEDAVRVLATGTVATIDVGRFIPDHGTERSFLHAAGLGVHAGFARRAASVSLRRRLGRFTYLMATAAAMRARRPFTCDILTEDRRVRLALVHLMVFNVPLYGGPLNLHLAGGSIDDRRLDILAIEAMPLIRFMLALAPMLAGRTPWAHGTYVFGARRVRIVPDRALDVALDGEIAGRAPGTFVLQPRALRVMAPHTDADNSSRGL